VTWDSLCTLHSTKQILHLLLHTNDHFSILWIYVCMSPPCVNLSDSQLVFILMLSDELCNENSQIHTHNATGLICDTSTFTLCHSAALSSSHTTGVRGLGHHQRDSLVQSTHYFISLAFTILTHPHYILFTCCPTACVWWVFQAHSFPNKFLQIVGWS
jgi:hypothetical protein